MKKNRDTLTFLVLVLFLLPTSYVFAIQESSISILGAEKNIDAELIMPDGPGPFPAVLVLHTSGGLKKYDLDYAEKLGQEGYACLVPNYFKTYSLSADTGTWATTVYAEKILTDFRAEIKYLKKQPKINKDKIGAVGFSMGGYWALVLAALGDVQAGVSYYGALTGGGSADSDIKYHFDEIFTQKSSPVLLLHGKEDLTVNVRFAQQLADMLRAKGSVYELQLYPHAGHRFERAGSLDKPAARDSWKRTLAFFGRYL